MDSENHRKPRTRRHFWVIKKKGSGAERKEMGLRPAGAMGAKGRGCGRGDARSSKVAGARAGWDSGASRGPGGVGCWDMEPRTQQNEKGKRGGGSLETGVHPWSRLRRPPESRGLLLGRAEETGWEGHSQISWICRRHRPPQAARRGYGPSSCPGSRGRAPGPHQEAPCPGSRWLVTTHLHRSRPADPSRPPPPSSSLPGRRAPPH